MILDVGKHTSSEHWPGYTCYGSDYGAGITHVTSRGMLQIIIFIELLCNVQTLIPGDKTNVW